MTQTTFAKDHRMSHLPSRRALLGAGVGLASSATLPIAIAQENETSKEISSPARATPLAQDYTVIHHNPDRQRYVEGPGLVRLSDGRLVAVVPVIPRNEWRDRRQKESRSHILLSGDGGKTWQQQSELPYYSAIPWIHNGHLYLFANKGGTIHRNDDLLILCSSDAGQTWTDPVTLFQGHFWNCHTGMVQDEKQLVWAIDDLAAGPRGPCVLMGDLTRDPLDPAAWRMSKPVPYFGVPKQMVNPRFGGPSGQYLEPNVIRVAGKLRVLLTVKPNGQTTANLSAVFDVEEKNGELTLKFVQFYPLPGAQLKFCVIRDEVSNMFWATANFVVDSQGVFDWYRSLGNSFTGGKTGGNDRRFLMLMYGLDGLNWFPAGCVAQASSLSQSFMYATPVIDGDDLAIIARSSIRGPNQHDADTATFHRVRNFRQLALNLFPTES